MERGFKSVGINRSDEGRKGKEGYPFSLLIIAACPHPVKLEPKTKLQFDNLESLNLCLQIMTGH